jgi:hypothetical protein
MIPKDRFDEMYKASVRYGSLWGEDWVQRADNFMSGAVWADKTAKYPWISVDEHLPHFLAEYLVCTKDGSVYVAHYDHKRGEFFNQFGTLDVTHWMPIVKPDGTGGFR